MEESKIDVMSICGGALSLDFVNTCSMWLPEFNLDYIADYDDYMKWVKRLEVLDRKELSAFSAASPAHPEKILKHLRTLRQVLFDVFSGIAEHRKAPKAMELLIPYLETAARQTTYRTDKQGAVHKAFNGKEPELAPLWHVLQSAEKLLLDHENWPRIRMCPACGWLFADSSKGGKRKWCVMALCGSREKSSRYYHNQRSA